MSIIGAMVTESLPAIPNGSGAAAVLSAGIGSIAVAFFSIAADQSSYLKTLLEIYKPTGALSGVTTAAIAVWLVTWAILEWRWRRRTVSLARINIIAFVLLGLSLLLTIPQVEDLF